MSKKQLPIAACLVSLSPLAGAIQLFPAGQFDAPRGALRGQGPWQLTAVTAQQLIDKVASRKNPLCIDYEHQSLLAATNGQPVPAAGWIDGSSLVWRDDPDASGLFATNVRWTAAASQHIEADEYRYLSPVFSYDPKTGTVLDVLNVALTNNPAIDGMQAVTLAAASLLTSSELPTMDIDEVLERLRYVLNLPTLATVADISAELDKLKTLMDSQTTAATSVMDLLAAQETQIAALTTASPDPAQFAPIAALTEAQNHNAALQADIAALSAKQLQQDIQSRIQPALDDGRLLDGQREFAEKLGATSLASLDEFIATLKPIAALNAMQTGGKAPTDHAVNQKTPEQLAAAAVQYQHQQAQLGLSVTTVQAIEHVSKGAYPWPI